jgi:hypothetical protein
MTNFAIYLLALHTTFVRLSTSTEYDIQRLNRAIGDPVLAANNVPIL